MIPIFQHVRFYSQRPEVSVHWFDVAGSRVPVAEASNACVMRSKRCGLSRAQREAARRQLVFRLWQRLNQTSPACASLIGKAPESSEAIMFEKNMWGKPAVRTTAGNGPAVSFSCGNGECWAAACSPRIDLGLDAATAEEFAGPYPLLRVFQPVELESAAATVCIDVTEAAALVWSLKEAAVKALGCGFHLVDPSNITFSPKAGETPGTSWNIHPAKQIVDSLPGLHNRPIYAYTLRRHRTWLAFVLIPVHATYRGNGFHEGPGT